MSFSSNISNALNDLQIFENGTLMIPINENGKGSQKEEENGEAAVTGLDEDNSPSGIEQ